MHNNTTKPARPILGDLVLVVVGGKPRLGVVKTIGQTYSGKPGPNRLRYTVAPCMLVGDKVEILNGMSAIKDLKIGRLAVVSSDHEAAKGAAKWPTPLDSARGWQGPSRGMVRTAKRLGVALETATPEQLATVTTAFEAGL